MRRSRRVRTRLRARSSSELTLDLVRLDQNACSKPVHAAFPVHVVHEAYGVAFVGRERRRDVRQSDAELVAAGSEIGG